MTVFPWPDGLAPTSQDAFEVDAIVAVYQDPANGRALRQYRGSARWTASLHFENMTECVRKEYQALKARLRGAIHSVRLWDFADGGCCAGEVDGGVFSDNTVFSDGLGFADGEVTFAAAGARGDDEIELEFYDTLETPLIAGDKIGFADDRLHLVVDTVSLGASDIGVATVKIFPPLWENMASGAAVTVFRPTARFFLQSGAPVSTDVARFGSGSLNFVEEVR